MSAGSSRCTGPGAAGRRRARRPSPAGGAAGRYAVPPGPAGDGGCSSSRRRPPRMRRSGAARSHVTRVYLRVCDRDFPDIARGFGPSRAYGTLAPWGAPSTSGPVVRLRTEQPPPSGDDPRPGGGLSRSSAPRASPGGTPSAS
ncbi:hypothetical protein SBRY_11056 [Actinacidiphila bryophytorum]|uniref:Uncharacterized protein n=1 Tax=Actinacidiphila bryophytorum TaxID=1436133 RepID=A0A9W4GXF2_9ACTN|nr:hypothetical protein SBRY_11056 [Actinacidiphila bryophytorum]